MSLSVLGASTGSLSSVGLGGNNNGGGGGGGGPGTGPSGGISALGPPGHTGSLPGHGRSLRNDLLVAADSVTNAMSTLVRELNSGKSSNAQGPNAKMQMKQNLCLVLIHMHIEQN